MTIQSAYVLTNTADSRSGWLNADTGTKDCTLTRTRQTARIQRESRMDKPARQEITKVHTTTKNFPFYQLSYQNCSKIQSPTRTTSGTSYKPKDYSYRNSLAKAPPCGGLAKNWVTEGIYHYLIAKTQGTVVQNYPSNFIPRTSCPEIDNSKNITKRPTLNR
jgi:hypothetical protein